MQDASVRECYVLPEGEDVKFIYRLLANDPDEQYYWERVDRNIGWITQREQEVLRRSVIGIAGCGGMGGQLAEKFLRLGVGEIRIADCEVFDISNINRQFAATRKNVGQSKAFETARMLRALTDDTTIMVFPQGICHGTVCQFLTGCDVVCDEIEFWAVGARILLHQKARKHGIPVFNCNTVGFGSRLFLFTPTSVTMEACLGYSYKEAARVEERIQKRIADAEEIQQVMERVLCGLVPELPDYRPSAADGGDHAVVRDRLFREGKATIIATNPSMATGFVADRVLLRLLGISGEKRHIVEVPEMPGYLFFDAATMVAKKVTGAWWNTEHAL